MTAKKWAITEAWSSSLEQILASSTCVSNNPSVTRNANSRQYRAREYLRRDSETASTSGTLLNSKLLYVKASLWKRIVVRVDDKLTGVYSAAVSCYTVQPDTRSLLYLAANHYKPVKPVVYVAWRLSKTTPADMVTFVMWFAWCGVNLKPSPHKPRHAIFKMVWSGFSQL